jgi:hypothetical protein
MALRELRLQRRDRRREEVLSASGNDPVGRQREWCGRGVLRVSPRYSRCRSILALSYDRIETGGLRLPRRESDVVRPA